MFQFRRFPSYTYVFSIWYVSNTHMDCSIRISAGLCSLTAHRSFSQLTTSFIGSQCQGIRPALLLALPFVFSEFSLIHCSFIYPTSKLKFKNRVVSLDCISSYFSYSIFKMPFSLYLFRNRCQKTFLCFLISVSEYLGGHKWTRTTDLTLIRRAL